MNSECPLLVIQCKFHEAGCAFKVPWQEDIALILPRFNSSLPDHLPWLFIIYGKMSNNDRARNEREVTFKKAEPAGHYCGTEVEQ